MIPGDIAFKCNFAYINKNTGIVEKRRVDREFHHWGLELIDVIDGMTIPGFPDYKVAARHATEHRIGLKVSGPGLTNKISGTDPLVDNLPLKTVRPKDDTEASKRTSEIVK